jgi:hypothetical protein
MRAFSGAWFQARSSKLVARSPEAFNRKLMPVVVIGGHSRKVGKTSVVAGLISALPDLHWTALKITQHGHDIPANGEAGESAAGIPSWAVSEETDRSGESDTSRFLAAGAAHSWWVRTAPGRLADAIPRIRQILAGAENAVVESNSILHFLQPDLYLTVLDPQTADFKASAQEFLDRTDAVLLHATPGTAVPAWERISLKLPANRPVFTIHPPQYVTPEIVELVRTRLRAS